MSNPPQPSARLLALQVSAMSAALHAICIALTKHQKRTAFDIFEPAMQVLQASLEASKAPEEDLTALLEMRRTLHAALLRPSANQ